MKKDKYFKSTNDLLKLKPKNWALMGASLISVVLGFYLLHIGSMSAAPVLLFIGYFVLFPLGIFIK